LLGGTVSDTQQNGLWALDARNSLPASGQITTARLIGTVDLNLAAGTLTYNTANAPVAAVPEPSSYALVIAGLAVLGVFARRRRAA
jgi:PEP-CTERM motif